MVSHAGPVRQEDNDLYESYSRKKNSDGWYPIDYFLTSNLKANEMHIGITGINGLIGWHLRAFLHTQPEVEVSGADRSVWTSRDRLHRFVEGCDVIVHLAGMICGDVQELAETNRALTSSLIDALEQTGSRPQVLFASSTHIHRGTAYGQSKQACTDLWRRWAADNESSFTNLIIPNVFGEGGKPFYNSVVSTFCHQLAKGETTQVHRRYRDAADPRSVACSSDIPNHH